MHGMSCARPKGMNHTRIATAAIALLMPLGACGIATPSGAATKIRERRFPKRGCRAAIKLRIERQSG
jgi:hypothetical protein